MNYFGQNKITYDISVENKLIVIKNVTLDSPFDSKSLFWCPVLNRTLT
jgi:hypothetical protein